MTRYAIYCAPRAESPWWKAGSQWLGRDAASGIELAQPALPALPHLLLPKLTSDARRYGFHATLKAPFRLQCGFTEAHLLAMVEAFCAAQRPLYLPDLQVCRLRRTMVLQPQGPAPEVDALAQRCVSFFDLLRAAPTAEEQRKYRARGLDAREQELLARWGYPYTEDRFRFHLTLSDSLDGCDAATAGALEEAARQHFARAMAAEPFPIDGIAVFREIEPGAPFQIWKRFAFDARVRMPDLPRAGRLLYVVGAERLPREALRTWLRTHLPAGTEPFFAQRTITRPAQGGDRHEPVDESTFWQLAEAGHFAMTWREDGLCYGIRRSIEVELATGRDVVVNGSARHVPALRKLFPQAQVIWLDEQAAAAMDGSADLLPLTGTDHG